MSSPDGVAEGPEFAGAFAGEPRAVIALAQINTMEELGAYGFDVGEFVDAENLNQSLTLIARKLLSYRVIATWGLWQKLFKIMSDFFPD